MIFSVASINHHEQALGSLAVLQKLVSESLVQMGTLNDSRQISEEQLILVDELRNSDVRAQRRERIRSDFRKSSRQSCQKRALSCVRKPNESHVGDHLQTQLVLLLLPALARHGFLYLPPFIVAESTSATPCHHEVRSLFIQICQFYLVFPEVIELFDVIFKFSLQLVAFVRQLDFSDLGISELETIEDFVNFGAKGNRK